MSKAVKDITANPEFKEYLREYVETTLCETTINSFRKCMDGLVGYSSPPTWFDFNDNQTSVCRESARFAYVDSLDNDLPSFCVSAKLRNEMNLFQYITKVENLLKIKSKIIFDSSRNLIFSTQSPWLDNVLSFELFSVIIKAYYRINLSFNTLDQFIANLRKISNNSELYFNDPLIIFLIKNFSRIGDDFNIVFQEYYDYNENGILSFSEENENLGFLVDLK